jgi:hypothetical protein
VFIRNYADIALNKIIMSSLKSSKNSDNVLRAIISYIYYCVIVKRIVQKQHVYASK